MTFNFTEVPDAGSPVRRRTAHGPSGSDTDEDDAASPIEARDSRTFSTTASPTTSPIPPSAQAPGSMEGVETSPGADVAPRNERLFDPDASIVLIGCRGAGKRSLAFIGALHLRRRLVTEDSYFEQQTGLTRAGFLAKHGKDALGRRSADVFKRMLSAHDRRCIIVCGFGSFSEEGHAALRAFGAAHPVVYVHREKEHVSRFLDPADADHILKADRTHRDCANFEYYNLYDPDDRSGCGTGGQSTPADPTAGGITTDAPSKLLNAKEDFTRFLDLLHSQAWRRIWLESPFSVNAVPPHFRAFSCALRLRLSYLVTFSPSHWDDADLEAQGDCVELIIDHWPDDLLTVVARTVALVRRKLAVPIIFHVEETPRGERKRSLAERDATDTKLLDLGLHLNVDYISLDLQRTPSLVRRVLARKGRTKVVGNIWYTGFGAPAWSDPVQEAHYRRAQALGCDVVRMVRFCAGDSTHERLVEFRERIERTIPDPKPVLVAYDYSVLGVRTPLQPAVFRPIKLHGSETIRDHLATVCSYRGSTELLFQDFTLVPLRFYTLGAHVTYSITPAIHNAAYAFTGLKHSYHAVRTETLEQVASLCGQPTFGGATLAAPFKVAILPSVQLTSQHAAAIGAVNVVIPLRGAAADGSPSQRILDHCNARNRAGQRGLGGDGLYGDNTDWSSILACLRRAMSPRNYVRPSTTSALVIGAGGMARAAIYALLQLGCRNIVVHNRTTARAHEVAAHFNEWATKQLAQGLGKEKENQAVTVVHVITDVRQPWPASFDPPTMVVSCVPAMSNDGSPPPDFEMPRQWLGSTTGGVVVELAYEPLITPLVAQMRNLRTSFSSTPSSPTMSSLPAASPAWRVVDGLDVVGEMAISAFELNTGCVAPRRLMRDVCRRTWEEQRRQHGIGEADEGDGDDDEYGGSYTTSVSGMGVGSGIDGGTNGTYGHGEAMEE